MATVPDLLDVLATGSRTSVELQARLGVSQPTISRLLKAAADLVLPIGRARATRYARRRAVPEVGNVVSLYRVDEEGLVRHVGHLYPLAAGEFAVALQNRAPELHPGLPWFMQDIRPQGFMGRAFAQHFAARLQLPPRLPDWTDDAHLTAMALFGDDLAGNLIVGETSLERFYQRELVMDAIPEGDRDTAYARLAESFLDEQPGSSAGGEQPKFTARLALPDGSRRAVIVKFSPKGDETAARRWRDLLHAEHAALALLSEHGVPAAASRLLEAGGRLFLEVERFDRCGSLGRRGVLSLASIDDHYFGRRGTWTDVAGRLAQARLIYSDEARHIRFLDTFGALIANTDRHFGNLSLFANVTLSDGHAVAPVYDMLPMAYRPTDQGEVRTVEFRPPTPTAATHDVWVKALRMAYLYWRRLAATAEMSEGMRWAAAQNAERLVQMQRLVAPVSI